MRLPSSPGSERQARILLERRDAIVEAWERSLAGPGVSARAPSLRDDVPDLLERVAAELIGRSGAPLRERAQLERDAARHGRTRARQGFDVRQVLAELRVLRERVLDAWEAAGVVDAPGVRALDRALDEAADVTACAVTDTHAALLRGVDAISRASIESRSIDELLSRLLDALVSVSRDVDTAAVLLRSGDVLRVRAERGLPGEVERGFELRMGEGFAGKVALERKPLHLSDAANDPLVLSAGIRHRGVRALYGVPLVNEGDLVGVAHMGSATVSAFRAEDVGLFGSMASRAALGIARHLAAEEARRAARDREEARALLEALFEAAPAGIAFWDRDLRFVRVNRWLAEVNGYPVEEHIGRTPGELLRNIEGLDATMARWREVLRTGRPWMGAEIAGETAARPGERRIWREDFFPVRLGGEIVGLGAVVLDVTEERRSAAELALLARLSRDLVEDLELTPRLRRAAEIAVPEFADLSALVVLEGGVPRRVAMHAASPESARTAREMLETYPVDLGAERGVGRVLREGVPELAREVDAAFVRGAAPGERGRRMLEALGLTSYLAVPMRSPGGAVAGALAFGMIGSGRRFDERSLRFAEELASRISLAIENARLFEAERREARVREQVLAVVSHDLRNPLSAVLMSAQKLLASAPPGAGGDAIRRSAAVVRRAAGRMERLIGDLLDAAAIQGGSLTVNPEPRAPGELVREAADAMQGIARERGVALEVDAAPELPDVLADRDRVLQVLGNLVANAVKVSAPGGRIGLRAEARGASVRFEVADRGPGISPADRERLFEPYSRGTGADYPGAGLGLAISRGIVDAHGGEIGVDSEPGDGATFWFTLPVAPSGAEAGQPDPDGPTAALDRRARGRAAP